VDDILLVYKERPKLRSPVLIEGLPGVGNVGKLAAEHLVDQLKAVKFIEMYSKHFPPQVLVNDSGTIRLVSNEFFYIKRPEAENDIVVLVGDYQGLTPEGQYELSDRILTIAKELGVGMIFTLGGYGLGKMIDKPIVERARRVLALAGEVEA